jgi:hypothetical protein
MVADAELDKSHAGGHRVCTYGLRKLLVPREPRMPIRTMSPAWLLVGMLLVIGHNTQFHLECCQLKAVSESILCI